MALRGQYFERGINLRHGYLAEYYAENADFLVKIPQGLKHVGVLLEPFTVVECQRRNKTHRDALYPLSSSCAVRIPNSRASGSTVCSHVATFRRGRSGRYRQPPDRRSLEEFDQEFPSCIQLAISIRRAEPWEAQGGWLHFPRFDRLATLCLRTTSPGDIVLAILNARWFRIVRRAVTYDGPVGRRVPAGLG